mgnify:CR=1 FL=1
MEKKKELLFSVTKDDCDWSYTKGTGSGGQKKNKTSSAVHCKHRASGAKAYSESSRSQLDNKREAFVKMCETETFKKWHRLETLRRTGMMDQIDRKVAEENMAKLDECRIVGFEMSIRVKLQTVGMVHFASARAVSPSTADSRE